jgi:hypothetical protein
LLSKCRNWAEGAPTGAASGDDSCPGESQHFVAQLETTREDKFGVERDDLMEQQEEERQAGLQDGPISASFN